MIQKEIVHRGNGKESYPIGRAGRERYEKTLETLNNFERDYNNNNDNQTPTGSTIEQKTVKRDNSDLSSISQITANGLAAYKDASNGSTDKLVADPKEAKMMHSTH